MPYDDYEGYLANGTPNMGRTYTSISEGGGPIFLGNTRDGLTYDSHIMFGYFIDVFANNTTYNIGKAEVISKSKEYNNYLRLSHNLLGCPETELWTGTPVRFNSASVSESGNNVTVNTGGVAGSTICIMSALDNGSSYYQKMDNASSGTFTNVVKPYLVTITKHNYIPYLKNPDNLYFQNESVN